MTSVCNACGMKADRMWALPLFSAQSGKTLWQRRHFDPQRDFDLRGDLSTMDASKVPILCATPDNVARLPLKSARSSVTRIISRAMTLSVRIS